MQTLPGWCVVEPEEKKKEGGLFLPETAKSEMQQGMIVEVSPEYYKDGIQIKLPLKKGMKVSFKKYYDNDLDLNGKKYKVAHCDNIQVILD